MELSRLNPFSEYFLRSRNRVEAEQEEQQIRNSQGVSQEEEQIIAASQNAHNLGYSTGATTGDFASSNIAFRSIFANKTQKVNTYREMSYYPEIHNALNVICDEAITPDANGDYVKLKILKEVPLREEKHIRKSFEYINNEVLKFRERGWTLFRTWLIESELFLEKILNDRGSKIVGIKLLPCTNTYPIYEANVIKYYVQTNKKVSRYRLQTSQDETRFETDQISYINFGDYGYNQLDTRGYLEASIRTWNQLRNLEDAILIYRLARAPERRLWNVELGRLPPGKAEEFLKNMIFKYRTNLNYNSQTGTIDTQKAFQALTEDYWFGKREGQGTSVEILQSGMNLGELNDVNMFLTKLYLTLQIPKSRWQDTLNTVATNMAPGEITREEVHFSRMVERFRSRFKKIFIDLLTTQLRLSNQIDQKYTKASLFDIEFCEDNVFAEQKHLLNVKSKLEVLSMITPDIANKDNPNGIWSRKFALTRMINMSEEDYELNEKLKREEIAEQKAEEPEGEATETPEDTTEETPEDEEGFTPPGGEQETSTATKEAGAEAEPPPEPGPKKKESDNQEGTGEKSIFIP